MGARSRLRVAAVAGLLAIASPAASDTVDPEYREMVTRYARGERALALVGVARFSDAELVRIARAVEAATLAVERAKTAQLDVKAAEPPVPLRAAVMLHLDLDYAKPPESAGGRRRWRRPAIRGGMAARESGPGPGCAQNRWIRRPFFTGLAPGCPWGGGRPAGARWG